MKSSSQFESSQAKDVVDEGLLLSYFLNTDSNDAMQPNIKNNNGYPNRIYDCAAVSGRNATTTVRFAQDTIRTTTEQGTLSSSTPAVYFYPSSTKVKVQNVDGGNMTHTLLASSGIFPNPGLEKNHSQMHRSLPSFNSMASTLLKDTWVGAMDHTTELLLSSSAAAASINPMQSDVSPITPTGQIGLGLETLIFPPAHVGATSTFVTQVPISNANVPTINLTSIDIGHKRNGDYVQINNYTQGADLNTSIMHSTPLASTPSVPTMLGKETVQRPQTSIIGASQNDNNTNNNHMHLQWLQQINSHIQPPSRNKPSTTTGSFSHAHVGSNAVDFVPLQASIEFTPTGPFLNALSNVQRELAAGIDASKIESEEKRARRLERNRESARQSRRRKKERLVKLSTKVHKLQADIDSERRKKIECMEKYLRLKRSRMIQEIFELIQPKIHAGEWVLETKRDSSTNKLHRMNTEEDVQPDLQVSIDISMTDSEIEQTDSVPQTLTINLHTMLERLGPNSNARRAVASFQYQLLRHLIMEEYQKVILWLLFKGESFFTFAREKHSKISKCSFRIASKQIGEALATEQKKTSGADNNSSMSCDAHDSERLWPFLCHDLSLGFDQEEKILQLLQSAIDNESLSSTLIRIRLALDLAQILQDGVLYQSHTSTFRCESTLLHILTPTQSALFLQWMERNRDKVHGSFQKIFASNINSSVSSLNDGAEAVSQSTFTPAGTDISVMNELCEKLKGSLMIPTAIATSKE